MCNFSGKGLRNNALFLQTKHLSVMPPILSVICLCFGKSYSVWEVQIFSDPPKFLTEIFIKPDMIHHYFAIDSIESKIRPVCFSRKNKLGKRQLRF